LGNRLARRLRRIAAGCSALLLLSPLLTHATERPRIDDPLRTGQTAVEDSAVVIGIEEYPFLELDVPYALRDAEAFESLAIYTLGIPPSRVHLLRSPTCAQMVKALQRAGEETGADGKVYVFFAGHGASSTEGERLILGADVPYDLDLFEDSGLTLARVQRLAGIGGAHVVLMVDACYIGVGRTGGALIEGGRTFVPRSALESEPRSTVWNAAGFDEVAGPLDAVQHGAFSYFAIGALRGWADGELDGKRDGRVSTDEANRFVTRALKEVGIRSQHPSLVGEEGVLAAGRNLEGAPDLMALREAIPTAGRTGTGSGSAGGAKASTDGGLDIAELARRAEAAREAEAALHAAVEDELSDAESRLKQDARGEWLALAALLEHPDAHSRKVVEAYVAKYEAAAVSVQGQTRSVEVAQVDEAREWLFRQAGGLVSGGVGGAVLDDHGYEMVRIAPGEFRMGSPAGEEGRNDDEKRHTVRITQGFSLGTTEVTQSLYEAVMGDNPSKFRTARYPVEQVSWHDAVKLCNRLSEQEGLEPVYRISGTTVTWDRSADGYRLPTEAEWEYAARGGEAHVYSGSADIGDVGWYGINSGRRPREVGKKRANGWGLYDMTGNVWEWVWDKYGDYPSGSVTDPVGSSAGYRRIYRGGSWSIQPKFARVAHRAKDDAVFQDSDLGFRLARTLP